MAQSFNKNWMKFYDLLYNYDKWNIYITVDPASKKKKDSDFTVMTVIGLAPDGNYYLLWAVRDRLNLTQRTKLLFDLVRQWKPISVGYEEYGMQCDREHIEYVQGIENYRFNIIPLGGNMAKVDRIKRLVPIMENYRFYFPHRQNYVTADGKIHDFMAEFIRDEYITFPVCVHDDAFDCISRVLDPDLKAQHPKITTPNPVLVPIGNQNGVEIAQGNSYDPLKQMEMAK